MKTETTALCVACDWQPDPTRRMGIDAQAEEHMREAKHVVVTSTRPLSELIEDPPIE